MNKLLESVDNPSVPFHKNPANPITEYQNWRMMNARLLMESDCAKEKGHWKEAEKLQQEARIITRYYYDIRGIR
jgi:hypothetical protein